MSLESDFLARLLTCGLNSGHSGAAVARLAQRSRNLQQALRSFFSAPPLR